MHTLGVQPKLELKRRACDRFVTAIFLLMRIPAVRSTISVVILMVDVYCLIRRTVIRYLPVCFAMDLHCGHHSREKQQILQEASTVDTVRKREHASPDQQLALRSEKGKIFNDASFKCKVNVAAADHNLVRNE